MIRKIIMTLQLKNSTIKQTQLQIFNERKDANMNFKEFSVYSLSIS